MARRSSTTGSGTVLGLGDREVWNYVVVRLATDYRWSYDSRTSRSTGTARLVRLGTSSVTLHLELRAASDGRVAAETECVFAAWDSEARTSRPLTDDERARLESAA